MLAALIQPPRTESDWLRWGFDHLDSHDRIRKAIQARGGPNLTAYILYPINLGDFRSFLEVNQQAHIEMDAAVGSQSQDLEELDPRDERQLQAWLWSHFLEHQTAENALGL